jgi:CheY-like chemotaxis protein
MQVTEQYMLDHGPGASHARPESGVHTLTTSDGEFTDARETLRSHPRIGTTVSSPLDVAGTVASGSTRWNDGGPVHTLVIVDDSHEFLASAEAMLREEGFDVVGCVSDASRAVEEVRLLQPDVVLLDVQLPILNGFELARRLADLDPRPIVILISSRDAAAYGSEITSAPVRGFISKWELSGDALAAMV